jgi:hypothetical protein
MNYKADLDHREQSRRQAQGNKQKKQEANTSL